MMLILRLAQFAWKNQPISGLTKSGRARMRRLIGPFFSRILKARRRSQLLKRFLKGNQNPSALVFRSKRGSPLRETNVLHEFLHPVLKALGLPQAGMHAFRHGCNRRWVLAGMNPAVLPNRWDTALL
jgi:integrase